MAGAGEERQRHCMSDVRSDDPAGRHFRMQDQQHRHADGAGADRRGGDQRTHHHAERDGQKTRVAQIETIEAAGIALANHSTRQQKRRGDEQHAAERNGKYMLRGGAFEIELRQHKKCRKNRWHAADRQRADQEPIDRSRGAVHDGAGRLGGGGEQQVGADRRRRVDAEQQDEQRRQQRAAADSGHADQSADAKPGRGVEKIRRDQIVHTPLVISPGSEIVRRSAQKSLSKNEQKILRYSTDRRSDDRFVSRADRLSFKGIRNPGATGDRAPGRSRRFAIFANARTTGYASGANEGDAPNRSRRPNSRRNSRVRRVSINSRGRRRNSRRNTGAACAIVRSWTWRTQSSDRVRTTLSISSIGQNEDASRAQVSFHSRDFDLPRRRARIRGHDGADLQYPVLLELGG